MGRRTTPPPTPTDATPDAAPEKKERAPDGKFLPGSSGNPGGLPKAYREMRAAFLEDVPTARAKLLALMKDGPPAVQFQAAAAILARGLGKDPKASELLEAEALPEAQGTLADTVRRLEGLVSRAAAGIERRMESGDIGPDTLSSLADLLRAAGEVHKRGEEARKSSGADKLPTEELLRMVLAAVGPEKVRAVLAEVEAPRG